MSTGLPADTNTRSNVFQNTAIALGASLLGVVILYFLGGKSVLEATQRAEANRKQVDEVRASLQQAETEAERTQGDLEKLRLQLESLSVPLEDREKLAERLQALEKSRAQDEETARRLAELAGQAASDRGRNRARIAEATSLGQRITVELDELEKELASWTGTMSALPKGDPGRKLATSPAAVAQFVALSDAAVVDFARFDLWRDQLDAVYPRIQSAHENHDFVVVTDEDLDFLNGLLAEVQTSRRTLRQYQRSLDVLLASVRDVDPGQATLEDAILARQAEADAAFLSQLAEKRQLAIDAVDAEYAEKLAEEHRVQREIANQQRLRAAEFQTADMQKELERIAAEARKAQAVQEREKLLQEFERDRANIQSLLAPFVDLAITQPSGTNPISKGGIKRPTSFGALQSSGALEDTRSGMDFLYHIGGHPANMRNKGSFPSFVSMSPIPNESVRSQVRRAQQLLVKYGDIMVEKGLLSP